MRNLSRLVVIIIATYIYILPCYAKPANWQFWSDKTLIEAQQKNRLILINLTAKWCIYCKKMRQITYQDKKVITELNQHYIAILADEAEFPELAKRFAKIGRPGTIILDQQGNQLVAKSGYLKPQWMLWMLQGASAEFNHKMLLKN